VDDLLTQGATVDVKDKNSESPLFLAVRCGHKDIIELLLERGANPEISNACGKKLIDSICDQSEAKDQLKQGLALYRILNLLSMW
jgi:ankyrin repeat protein